MTDSLRQPAQPCPDPAAWAASAQPAARGRPAHPVVAYPAGGVSDEWRAR